jgi:hypothetical protein
MWGCSFFAASIRDWMKSGFLEFEGVVTDWTGISYWGGEEVY